ncbi:hypothetical protein PG637_08375 [Riemerella anatipestifer]|uniref:hypothetical protein n=1 Tax=Riemerella anatipestifer TaxID=34085 RepID=UPI00129DBEF9|nr:hypothetical protein [Riemerella anatipestifer]MDY3319407.1 hypothetical protein [Riemerella anatipestifer]MDY3325678.1 hypothetical protein [Riemerella anatipestifer]MDY3354220.1 hypothetical protein [Riemerella anatipestifer]MRM82308.1 hypothetical protein [Riemerella anatipestifer]
MKINNIIILILIFLCIYSCKNQEANIGFTQNISDEWVYIIPNVYAPTRDSLKIDIPIEFKIKNNSSRNYDYIETIFYIDKKYIYTGDFKNIDKSTRKVKYDEEWELPKGEEDEIISRVKVLYINKDDAKRVFEKYSIQKDIEKFRDSVKIAPYKQFRKDFPEVIKKMDKTPDIVEVVVRYKNDKTYKSQKFKINW